MCEFNNILVLQYHFKIVISSYIQIRKKINIVAGHVASKRLLRWFRRQTPNVQNVRLDRYPPRRLVTVLIINPSGKNLLDRLIGIVVPNYTNSGG